MEPDAFFEPPDPLKYGYYRDKWTYDCTEDRLIKRLSEDKEKAILLVWTPGSSGLTAPEEQLSLLEAVRQRDAAHHKSQVRIAAFNSFIWGGLALLHSSGRRSAWWVLMPLVFLGVIPLIMNWWHLYRTRSFTAEMMTARIPDARFGAWMAGRRKPWTVALFVCVGTVAFMQYLVLPFAAEDYGHGAIQAAGIVKEAVWSGEVWRLLTGTFLHGAPLHLIFNMAALVGLSSIVEVAAHRTLVPVVFIVSAVTGSLFSLVFLPHATSVGSSGGILGLLGFVVFLGWEQKQHFPSALRRSLLISVVLIAGMGIAGYAFIDNAAHAGGMLAGLALGWGIARNQPRPGAVVCPPWLAIAGAVAWVVIGLTTVLCLYRLFGTISGPEFH
jgi:membrane associated rhomboid family serine protease